MIDKDEGIGGEGLPSGVQRLDKWLWYARIAKSRTLSALLVQDGRVRVNRAKAAKPSQSVRPGDVLTIAAPGGTVKIVKVLLPGVRRGPPSEARLLYELLTSMGAGMGAGAGVRSPGGALRGRGTGRPTKRDRRLTDRLNTEES